MDWILEHIIDLIGAGAAIMAAVTSRISVVRKKKMEALEDQVKSDEKKIANLRRELLSVYRNVSELLEIEKELNTELGINTPTSRKGHATDRHIQPKHVRTRIADLEQDLKLN